MSTTNFPFIMALAFGMLLGIILLVFCFINRRRLPKGMTAAFAAVGIIAVISASLMMAGIMMP
jgi:NhaP-type Na+/H+ and K+/H+ antiporter